MLEGCSLKYIKVNCFVYSEIVHTKPNARQSKRKFTVSKEELVLLLLHVSAENRGHRQGDTDVDTHIQRAIQGVQKW